MSDVLQRLQLIGGDVGAITLFKAEDKEPAGPLVGGNQCSGAATDRFLPSVIGCNEFCMADSKVACQ